ncbi:hypothetical protein [Sphingopyxis sp. GW247-27LB]|uniref:hypothetical protein n=1 Tax=Sphingopyxis sp. GW247-27LB TaxID=2012632 RepID=UPI000BA5D05D|nr:hypothetical protein [Sphingopyxis sp. GW247-27LB]PAL20191.1 hypothetical protein CD928_17430 [Sphingopyxis sp. GW247-27LB]
MGNLRPAPAALTPPRVDRLLVALDARDGLPILRTLGLTAEEIAAIGRIARKRGVRPIDIAATLLRAALEAVERAG